MSEWVNACVCIKYNNIWIYVYVIRENMNLFNLCLKFQHARVSTHTHTHTQHESRTYGLTCSNQSIYDGKNFSVCVRAIWNERQWKRTNEKEINGKRESRKRKVLFISSNDDNNNEIIFYSFDWSEWMLLNWRARACRTVDCSTRAGERERALGKIRKKQQQTFSSFLMA